jgi:hypothetical protein
MRLISRSRMIAIALAVGAIAAPTAQASGLAGTLSAPTFSSSVAQLHPDEQGSASAAAQASADRTAADRAAASPSAPLDRFALIKVHTVTPTTASAVTGNSGSGGFDVGDAAIGAGVMSGLVLLGIAGGLAVHRRRQPLHS